MLQHGQSHSSWEYWGARKTPWDGLAIRLWVVDTQEAGGAASLAPNQSLSRGFEARVVEVCGLVAGPSGWESHLPWDSVGGMGWLSWVVEDSTARTDSPLVSAEDYGCEQDWLFEEVEDCMHGTDSLLAKARRPGIGTGLPSLVAQEYAQL